MRNAINSYNHRKKEVNSLIKKGLHGKKRFKLLEKDFDIYSPKYKRLFSA